jgi:hypothetical protein
MRTDKLAQPYITFHTIDDERGVPCLIEIEMRPPWMVRGFCAACAMAFSATLIDTTDVLGTERLSATSLQSPAAF